MTIPLPHNPSSCVDWWLPRGLIWSVALLVACQAEVDPTRIPVTAAELAAAPLQSADQRQQVIAAELARLGGKSMTFSKLAVQSESERELIDGFRARIRIKDVVLSGVVDFHTAVDIWRPNELDGKIGDPGWTPDFALDGRRRYNALGAGRRPVGSVERFTVVARFVDLVPGWRWMDFVHYRPVAPTGGQP